MPRRVAVTTSSFGPVSPEPLRRLQAEGWEVATNRLGRKLQPGEVVELVHGAEAMIAGTEELDRPLLERLPALKVISRCGTGLDNVDLVAARELSITVFRTPDALTDAVAELTLAGALALLRHLVRADGESRAGEWSKPMGRLLLGSTVGVIGLGRIGRRLTELLRPFSVRVLAADPVQDPEWAAGLGVTYVSLETLLRESDLVTLHPSSPPSARPLLGKQELELMQPTALLINTARGGLVDEEALAEALRRGRIAGAYLDVFSSELYRGPLTELGNVLLTPHIGSYAAEARERMELEAVDNLLAFFAEEERS